MVYVNTWRYDITLGYNRSYPNLLIIQQQLTHLHTFSLIVFNKLTSVELMPPLTKAQKVARARKAKIDATHRQQSAMNNVASYEHVQDILETDDCDDEADAELQLIDSYAEHVELVERNLETVNDLQWVNGAGETSRPQVYTGDSDRTKRRRIAELKAAAVGSRRIDEFFDVTTGTSTSLQRNQHEVLSEEDLERKAMTMAVEGLAIFANVRKEVVGMKPVERCRLMSIRRYFILRLQGVKKLEASEMIARDIWSRGPRFARRLREWSRTFPMKT
jgi:hypothetical protein